MVGNGTLNVLARAVGNLQDAVLITEGERGPDGVRRIIFVNRAFSEMTGFTYEEAVGQLPDITIGPESDRDVLRLIQSARDALVPVRVELLKYRKDRTMFWAELDVVPVLDESRRCTLFLGLMRDVSERRTTHRRLMEADRLTTIGTLAAGVAHEMNNPLAYMMMNIGFLQEELPALIASAPDPSRWTELRTAVHEIENGASRVTQIVRDISTFSRTDPEPNGLSKVEPLLHRAAQMARAGIPGCARVAINCGPLPPVRGDASRLGQVFLNLLLNALQAIPRSDAEGRGVDVCAYESGEVVVVEVRDDGVGIPPEILPRIFDPFFTTKEAGKGIGLGLSIAHGIVRSLGGQLNVESTVAVGTLVRVSLPRMADELHARKSAPGEKAVEGVSQARLRILLVDDEPMILRSLERALKTQDDVVTCQSGKAALEALEASLGFDVILCDLSMPGMTGAELFATIARRWPGIEQRFILMTGGPCSETSRSFLADWKAPRVDKPIDLAVLRELIDAIRLKRGAWSSPIDSSVA
jgi:PAS domain S-box-containing protein